LRKGWPALPCGGRAGRRDLGPGFFSGGNGRRIRAHALRENLAPVLALAPLLGLACIVRGVVPRLSVAGSGTGQAAMLALGRRAFRAAARRPKASGYARIRRLGAGFGIFHFVVLLAPREPKPDAACA